MEKKTYREKLSQLITKAETEIDELRLKVALGKMNGADIFEDLKTELRDSVNNIISELKEERSALEASIHVTIENLRDLVAPGKIELLADYEKQKSKISEAISQLEQTIKDARLEISDNLRIKIENELEKFSLKMEVLQIRYELGRLELKDNVEIRKQKFRKQFEQLLSTIPEDNSESFEAYGKNLKDAYDKLREMIK